jgi:hypothetical protein
MVFYNPAGLKPNKMKASAFSIHRNATNKGDRFSNEPKSTDQSSCRTLTLPYWLIRGSDPELLKVEEKGNGGPDDEKVVRRYDG